MGKSCLEVSFPSLADALGVGRTRAGAEFRCRVRLVGPEGNYYRRYTVDWCCIVSGAEAGSLHLVVVDPLIGAFVWYPDEWQRNLLPDWLPEETVPQPGTEVSDLVEISGAGPWRLSALPDPLYGVTLDSFGCFLTAGPDAADPDNYRSWLSADQVLEVHSGELRLAAGWQWALGVATASYIRQGDYLTITGNSGDQIWNHFYLTANNWTLDKIAQLRFRWILVDAAGLVASGEFSPAVSDFDADGDPDSDPRGEQINDLWGPIPAWS
jgi:hypothetical protein